MTRELYGSAACPYTAQLREDLLWRQVPFVEYDVDADNDALTRLMELRDGEKLVPVLVEDGHVVQIGYEGRGCFAGSTG